MDSRNVREVGTAGSGGVLVYQGRRGSRKPPDAGVSKLAAGGAVF